MKKHHIKITLDARDYGRFIQVAKDMHIEKAAILAKKFVLDGIKKYRVDNPALVTEEKLLNGESLMPPGISQGEMELPPREPAA